MSNNNVANIIEMATKSNRDFTHTKPLPKNPYQAYINSLTVAGKAIILKPNISLEK
jgi:hypothetical protein